MIAGSTIRTAPLELSLDPRFRRRVVRLSAVSAVALGVLLWLVIAALETEALVVGAFLAGWVLMPTILLASLSHPKIRYALVVPASLVWLGVAVPSWAV